MGLLGAYDQVVLDTLNAMITSSNQLGKDIQEVYEYAVSFASSITYIHDRTHVSQQQQDERVEKIYEKEHSLCKFYLGSHKTCLNFISVLIDRAIERNQFDIIQQYFDQWMQKSEHLRKEIIWYKEKLDQYTNPVAKSYKLTSLLLFAQETYQLILQTLINYLDNAKYSLLVSGNREKLISACESYLSAIPNLNSQSLNQLVKFKHTYFLDNKSDDLLSKYELQLSNLKFKQLEKRFIELKHSNNIDPLMVYYGKEDSSIYKSPIPIPFPYEMLRQALQGIRQKYNIREGANISIHGITFVHSKEPYKSISSTVKIATFIPIYFSIPDEMNVLAFDNIPLSGSDSNKENSILKRSQFGWDIINNQPVKTKFRFFEPSERPKVFKHLFHKHSEQHFFEYLAKIDIAKFMGDLETQNRITRGCKFYMISFDMLSIRTSCNDCKLAEIAEQQVNDRYLGFTKRLQDYLLDGKSGYYVAGNKRNKVMLKATTRILAEKENSISKNNHQNPELRNVKYLDNLGIFEILSPTPAASGKKNNLKQDEEKAKRYKRQ